jgi:hypothetical protein
MDGANLYQCDKTSHTLSESFGGKIPHELGVPSASTLFAVILAGCSDKAKQLDKAMDSEAKATWNRPAVQFKWKGETWTLKRVKITGDMAYLNEIQACINDYSLRAIGSAPFPPNIAAMNKSKQTIKMRFSIPHVYTTLWKKKLVETREKLLRQRKRQVGSGDISATTLLGALDKFIKDELHLVPDHLTLCAVGWNHVDYGELHGGGTSSNRKLDQEVRMVVCGKGGPPTARVLFGNTATGRAEVRTQHYKVVCMCAHAYTCLH